MEDRISLKEAARLWSPPKSTNAVRAYAKAGLLIGDTTVRLEHVWSGGRVYTTRQAVLQFQKRCAEARERNGL